MSWLVGHTGRSFLDAWTIPHLGFWVFIGSTLWAVRVHRAVAVVYCLILALAWEGFEKYAEVRWPDRWLNPESWLNSWVSDPLTCVVGVVGMFLLLDKFGQRSAT